MAVVNAKYEFMMVDSGTNGHVSDGGVISNTTFGRLLEDGELSIPEPETSHEEDTISVPLFCLWLMTHLQWAKTCWSLTAEKATTI